VSKATTPSGKLQNLEQCTITIPGLRNPIVLNNLPSITDTKSASYNPGVILGRAMPIMTYSHSENRQISMTIHLYIIEDLDAVRNLNILRAIQSAVYPREGQSVIGDFGPSIPSPYKPPPVCSIQCGQLLASKPVCVVLQSYSVSFPDDVAWFTGGTSGFFEETYLPYRFDIQMQWLVVYDSSDLPFQNQIIKSGY